MAQYLYNFSDRPLGGFAHGQGMTLILSGSGTKTRSIIQDGNRKVFRIVQGGTSGQDLIAFDVTTNHGNDTEMLALFSVSAANQVPGSYGVAFWDYTASVQGASAGFLPASSVRSVMLYDDKAGVSFGHFDYLWNNGQKYWMRHRVEGGVNHYVKIWPDGTAEPGAWNLASTYSNRTTGTHYMGIGSYTANHTIDYFQVGIATSGETAPSSIVTDKAQVGAFSVNVLPTSAPAGGYSGGYGSIAGYGQAYSHSFTPTSTINDKNQTGVFRVKKTLDQAQTGRFRVKKTFDQTQTGKFRVRTTNDKLQVGLFRVRKDISQNQVGKFRIRKEFAQDQIGKFRIRKVFDQAQVGQFRIASEPSRPQVGKFRVQVNIERAQMGAFKVAAPSDQPQIGKFRVQVSVDRTILGKFRVRTSSDKNQAGQFRVIVKTDKSILGQFRVQTSITKTQVGRFAVRVTNDKPITGQFRIEYIGLKHQTGQFRVYGRNTFPEVFVPVDRYIAKKESDGLVSTAEVTSGNVYEGHIKSGIVEVGTIDASGDYNPNGISTGRIYSNNEHVILLWDDGSIWISEQNEEIMVEEYEEGGIMNMIPKKGTFKEGTVEHGDIQESL